jgi:hypothetical protein
MVEYMHKYPISRIVAMYEQQLYFSGYVCAPYLHDHKSIELKDSWINSDNIDSLYFVTGTFSIDSGPYFSDSTNHYLLAKFKDSNSITKDLQEHNQEKTTFLFNIREEIFQREVYGETNFITVYYLEYGDSDVDIQEIANIFLKREKIETCGVGHLNTFCTFPSKFTFPYSENIIVIEVASEKSHQSVKKYCEQTRRDVNRKGLTMTNLLSLSILEKLK